MVPIRSARYAVRLRMPPRARRKMHGKPGALAAFTLARDQAEVFAGVSAVRPCPNCGCGVMVLTTLISGDSES
jgi:hypothetical protein